MVRSRDALHGLPAAEINGASAPGYSSGQSEEAMGELLNGQLQTA